jgi:septum formation protein
VDEDTLKRQLDPMPPEALASRLAGAKATSLADLHPFATLIGSDQLVAFEGQCFGKPGSMTAAIEQLLAMSGREHRLITAVAVWHRGRILEHTDVATLRFRNLTRDEIERYVAADQPIDCAGAYKLEARGITLFERISSDDFTAITGLPLIALTTILREVGYSVP